jgi:hypothetical protein
MGSGTKADRRRHNVESSVVAILNPAPKGSKTGWNICGQKRRTRIAGQFLGRDRAAWQHHSALDPRGKGTEFAHYLYLEVCGF